LIIQRSGSVAGSGYVYLTNGSVSYRGIFVGIEKNYVFKINKIPVGSKSSNYKIKNFF
jgi:hypothetical protein